MSQFVSIVEDPPRIELTDWAILRLKPDLYFFFGIEAGELRKSSPIVSMDADGSGGRTRSGRIYVLEGPAMTDPLRDNRILGMLQSIDISARKVVVVDDPRRLAADMTCHTMVPW